jgi:uroporphyrin-III C-methyltransferase/precorrin-2 dehydrogenase/sirohydrochlorin ferrochelatase
MRSLPLFHQIAGQPVIVLGGGDAADARRRLVERAGGQVIDSIEEGIDKGARLAFVAHDKPSAAEGDAIRLRCAGLLVNVTDQPALCDFTMPSLLERGDVLVAVGTAGLSAGLAKALRLRLDAILPQRLGDLARKLFDARERLRARWPEGRERRHALDEALAEGGPLDPLADASADRVDEWLSGAATAAVPQQATILLRSDDPDDLTLREARMLGRADAILCDGDVPAAILKRARADAVRLPFALAGEQRPGLTILIRRR